MLHSRRSSGVWAGPWWGPRGARARRAGRHAAWSSCPPTTLAPAPAHVAAHDWMRALAPEACSPRSECGLAEGILDRRSRAISLTTTKSSVETFQQSLEGGCRMNPRRRTITKRKETLIMNGSFTVRNFQLTTIRNSGADEAQVQSSSNSHRPNKPESRRWQRPLRRRCHQPRRYPLHR